MGSGEEVTSMEVVVDGAGTNPNLVDTARAGFGEFGLVTSEGKVIGDLAVRNSEGSFSPMDMEFFGRVGEIVTMAAAA
ncbi:MAG: hypothetical protein ABI354_00870 [Candidatus Saccharimonadales bacterium]